MGEKLPMLELQSIDKASVKARLLRDLTARLERMIASANETRLGAIHEESRPENDKDTRGLEASYLARGQAFRVAELTDEKLRLEALRLREFGPDDPIALSALVEIEREDGLRRVVFLSPSGGGIVLEGEPEIQVLTSETPLGRALLGKRAGDDFTLRIQGRIQEYEIVAVS